MFYLCRDVLISQAHLSPSLITCIGKHDLYCNFFFLSYYCRWQGTHAHTSSQAHRQQSSGRTISADLKCHGSPRHPTSGRLWPRFGHARLNRSRTGCLFTQCRDRDGSLGATVKPKKKKKPRTALHKQAPPVHVHTRKQLSVIDGERHKGQQSAGLRLDRTRLLLHHLDSGDGADRDRSFPQSAASSATTL